MTDLDALALALLGYPRRRLLGALVRHWLARAIPESDDLPPREPAEPFLGWACRCAGHARTPPAEADRLRQRGRAAAVQRRRGRRPARGDARLAGLPAPP